MDKNHLKRYLIPAAICLLTIIGIPYYYFFTPLSTSSKPTYIYVDNDDNIDSIYLKIKPIATQHGFSGIKTLIRHSNYKNHIVTGRYVVRPKQGAFSVYRHLKNGLQEPVRLTIPSVRTLKKLASDISKKLMLDSATIYHNLTNESVCKKYGYDTLTIACMFIPNTYEIYWNITLEKFLDRMNEEKNIFWTSSRREKAKRMKLSENQVITLASIVDEETANNSEKPIIAGMYYNRLMLKNKEYPNGMPLQADPTIKYALKQFGLKRIYTKLLTINSPFNTYKNSGLPPGPIRIPSIAGIDAVLNYRKHEYLYMCAKEDFSGTHNFAKTYEDHIKNAKRYTKALNKRGIK